jgi:CBS domain-containing protein
MIVSELMTAKVCCCQITDSLEHVAQLMWEADVGALPVLADFGRPVAMVTDRDVCMAAYLTGRPLRDIPVITAASKHIFHVRPGDSIESVYAVMKMRRVRRLPVVGIGEHLDGIITVMDIVRHANELLGPTEPLHPRQIADALAEILRPHDPSRHPLAACDRPPRVASL